MYLIIGTPYITMKYFYIYLVSLNVNVNFTVRFRHRGFLVLRNDWLFIVMGEMEMWNNLYFGKLYLYIFGFVKI